MEKQTKIMMFSLDDQTPVTLDEIIKDNKGEGCTPLTHEEINEIGNLQVGEIWHNWPQYIRRAQ